MVNVAEPGHPPRFAAVEFGMVRHQPVLGAGGQHGAFNVGISFLAGAQPQPGMERAGMISEIQGVSERISAFTGAPTRLFRPPYGDWDLSLLGCVRDCGQIAVLWSVDAQSALSAQDMRAALDAVGPGDIVLMSLTDENVPEQLLDALDGMLARGLEICTVSELIGISGEMGTQMA